MEGNRAHSMDDKAAVRLCHRHLPNHGPQKKAIPDHLWPVRSAACPALSADVGMVAACVLIRMQFLLTHALPCLRIGSQPSHEEGEKGLTTGMCAAGFLAFGLLGVLPPLAGTALLLMTLGELAIAFSDVVIDGVVVECSRGEDQATAGSLQSICWGSQASLPL